MSIQRCDPMHQIRLQRIAALLFVASITCVSGCGPQPPKVVLDRPAEFPAALDGRQLFHTPNAYIYAHDELEAGEADRWVKQVGDYIHRKHDRSLGKGLVLVMSPTDRPIISTLEEQVAIEHDPSIQRTAPRHPKSVEEVRAKFTEEGISESVALRGAALPLTRAKLAALAAGVPDVPWAVSAPSEELAREVGVEMGVCIVGKRWPNTKKEQARNMLKGRAATLAKPLLVVRGQVVYTLWVQQQQDWNDDERREAILKHIRETLRANWLPVPSDEELQW